MVSQRLPQHSPDAVLRELADELRPTSASLVLLALEDLERQGPLPAEGWSLRGKALLMLQELQAARDSLAAGLVAHPLSLVLRLNLAAAELALGSATTALGLLEPLEPAELEHQQCAALLRNRASAASQCGQHELVVRDLEALRQLEGDSDSVLWSLAAAYEHTEALPQAALLYRQLLRDPAEFSSIGCS